MSGRIQRRSGAKSKGRDGLDVHASNDSSRAWRAGGFRVSERYRDCTIMRTLGRIYCRCFSRPRVSVSISNIDCHHLDAYYWPDIAFGFIRFMFPAAPSVGRARFFSKRHKIYVLARSSLGCYSDTHLFFLRGYIHISLVLVMFSALSFPPESPLPLGASSRTDHQAADVEVATRFLSSHSHIRCELSSFHLKASR